jgi:hypothetical protein
MRISEVPEEAYSAHKNLEPKVFALDQDESRELNAIL